MGQNELAYGYLIYWFKAGIDLNFLCRIHAKSAEHAPAVVNRWPDVLLVVGAVELELLHLYGHCDSVASYGAELAAGALVLDEEVPPLEPGPCPRQSSRRTGTRDPRGRASAQGSGGSACGLKKCLTPDQKETKPAFDGREEAASSDASHLVDPERDDEERHEEVHEASGPSAWTSRPGGGCQS